MILTEVQQWLEQCPVKNEVNDVIDGAVWLILHDAYDHEEDTNV